MSHSVVQQSFKFKKYSDKTVFKVHQTYFFITVLKKSYYNTLIYSNL